jgi:hypothetical protein
VLRTACGRVVKVLHPTLPPHRLRREIYCNVAAKAANPGVSLEAVRVVHLLSGLDVTVDVTAPGYHEALAKLPDLKRSLVLLVYAPSPPAHPLSRYPPPLPSSNSTAPLHLLPGIFSAVSSRLSALHALPLAHRDLKPSNLLPAALIDFGQSLPLAEVEGKQNPAVGTTTYKAPEQLMLPARGEK